MGGAGVVGAGAGMGVIRGGCERVCVWEGDVACRFFVGKQFRGMRLPELSLIIPFFSSLGSTKVMMFLSIGRTAEQWLFFHAGYWLAVLGGKRTFLVTHEVLV